MRKGRSSRRGRVSRPNVGPNSVPSLDAHASLPNVVIGVTPAPSSVSEAPTAEADAPVNHEVAASKRDTLMSPPAPTDAEPASEQRVRVADPVEDDAEALAVAEEHARIEAERIEAERIEAAMLEAARIEAAMIEAAMAEAAAIEASMIEAAKVEAARIEAAKVEEAKLEAARVEAAKVEEARLEAARIAASKVEDAKQEAALLEAAKIEEAKREAARIGAAKIEEAKIEAAKVVAASVPPPKVQAKVATLDKTLVDEKPPVMDAEPAPATREPKTAKVAPAEDEESVPPVGDLAVAEVAEQFFSEGDVSRLDTAAEEDLDEVALDKAQRKSDPAVVKRRAKLARYVTWAVGVSAALCLVAVVRTTFSSSSKTIAAAKAANAPVKSEVVVPKASPPPAVIEANPVEPAPAAEPAKPVVTGDAKEEKAKAKAALDKGKVADAIEAGERAVALDETDSEAWLLLGAAYQEKGDLPEMRRAYKSCLEKGTKDKFQRECRMFAR